MWSAFSRFGGLVAARVMGAPLWRSDGHGLGIALATLAFMLFSTMDLLGKWLSADCSIPQMMLFNAGFSLVPATILAWRTGGFGQLKTDRLGAHLLRSACSLIATFAAMTGFSLMPMADVYALLFTTPLLITALAVPLLGEQVGWRRWSAIIVGFAGVLIVLQPGAMPLGPGAFAAVASAVASACSIILVRRLSSSESTASIALYPNLAIALAMAVWSLMTWTPMSLGQMAVAAVAGLAGGTALMLLVAAYRRAAAAVVAPFQYSQMLWGVLFGYVAFGDVPAGGVVLGGGIVVASGLFILYREVILAEDARPADRPAPAATAGAQASV